MQIDSVISHRGAAQLLTENTIPAFEAARGLGANWIECDIRLSKDLVPVVYHDRTLKRLFNCCDPIDQLDWEHIRTLKFDDGTSIPSLERLLMYANAHGVNLNLELKYDDGVDYKAYAASIVQVLDRHKACHNQVFISSFSMPLLRHIREALPSIDLGVLLDITNWDHFSRNELPYITASYHNLQASLMAVNHEVLNAVRTYILKQVSDCILAYVVNEKGRYEQLKAWGIHGVFSDRLEVLI